MADSNGHTVMIDYEPVSTREYYFQRPDGSHVVIQDHTAGHKFGDVEDVGDHGAHFNVRPYDPRWDQNTVDHYLRKGHVPGTESHYSW
jgi:hypothetical protein